MKISDLADEAAGEWASKNLTGRRVLQCRLRIRVDPKTGGLLRTYEYRVNGKRIKKELIARYL